MKIRDLLSIIIMIGSVILGLWLSLGVLLAGGIEQAIIGFQTGDAGMAAWGIVRALFFEMGFLVTWIGFMIGVFVGD